MIKFMLALLAGELIWKSNHDWILGRVVNG
jgi:hypothetical protein